MELFYNIFQAVQSKIIEMFLFWALNHRINNNLWEKLVHLLLEESEGNVAEIDDASSLKRKRNVYKIIWTEIKIRGSAFHVHLYSKVLNFKKWRLW